MSRAIPQQVNELIPRRIPHTIGFSRYAIKFSGSEYATYGDIGPAPSIPYSVMVLFRIDNLSTHSGIAILRGNDRIYVTATYKRIHYIYSAVSYTHLTLPTN